MEAINLFYNSPSDWTMFGPRISQERARTMLPMLIDKAHQRETMTYGDLANHFNLKWAMPIRPAVVCTTGTLYLLERNQLPQAQFAWKYGKIPRIANMVTRAGGESAGWVAQQLENQEPPVEFQTLLDDIFNYERWDDVLKALGLRA